MPAHQLPPPSYDEEDEDDEEDDARYERDRPPLASDTLARRRFHAGILTPITNSTTIKARMMPVTMASPSFRSPESGPRGPR